MSSVSEITSAAKAAIVYLESANRVAYSNFTEEELEMVIAAYKLDSRTYHSYPHIRSMIATDTPELIKLLGLEKYNLSRQYQNLASFKHDLFQLLVDGGAPKGYEWLLGDNEEEQQIVTARILQDKTYIVKRPKEIEPVIFDLVCSIFGFSEGQQLSLVGGTDKKVGVNEFLSALENAHVMNKKGFGLQQIFIVTACIEATIPFLGEDRFYKLAERLAQTAGKYGIIPNEPIGDFIDFVVYSAVDTANRDVGNFEGRFAEFITNTKLLIPEMNPAIRKAAGVLNFRDSHMGSIGFMDAIAKGYINVFGSYKDFPSEQNIKEKNAAAKKNAKLGGQYLSVKFISTTFLAAAASAIHEPDIGIAEFAKGNKLLLEVMPSVRKTTLTEDEKVLLSSLKGDEMQVVRGYDIEASPIGHFMFKVKGQELLELFDSAKKCVVGNTIDAKRYLTEVREKIGADDFSAIFMAMIRGAKKNENRATALMSLSTEIAQIARSGKST